jgi:hypothetical protein
VLDIATFTVVGLLYWYGKYIQATSVDKVKCFLDLKYSVQSLELFRVFLEERKKERKKS